MSLTLHYAARSDVGLVRDENEDSVYAGPRLLAVADGMGGHAAGEVASSVAIAGLSALDGDVPDADLISALRDAAHNVNSQLRTMVAADDQLEGMGTTLTALLWDSRRLGVLHVGDSRAYLLRQNELSQITHDHTFVQTLIDEGRISPEEANTHPQRSLITKALDGREVEPDVSVRDVLPGDRYLICTDGLSSVISEDTIREALAGGSPQEAVNRLVDLALRSGAPDNVTCVVADVVEGPDSGPGAPVLGGAVLATRPPPPRPDTAAGRAALITARPPVEEPAPDHGPTGRRWRTPVLTAVVIVIVVAGALIAATAYIRSQWYVGSALAAGRQRVAIYQGLNATVGGFHLSTVKERTLLPVDRLPPYKQESLRSGIQVNSLTQARRLVDSLRSQICTTPTPRPTTRRKSRPTTGTGTRPSPSPTPRPSPSPSPTPSPSPIPGCGATP